MEGMLLVVVQDDSVCLPVRKEFMVLAEAAWDSSYVAKDDGFMDVNIKTVGRADTQETEANNLEAACSNYSATRGLTGTAVPAAAADAAGGIPISDAGGLDLDTQLANTHEVTAARMGVLTDWINGGRLDLILDIIAADVVNLDGAAMRGTDNAALASVVGALTDAAAAGDPTTADTVMQYVKQLINVLVGTTGVTAFPAEAGPANNVSLAEVLRAIHVDVTGLNGDAMRGTDSAYAGTPPTAAAIVNEWETQSQADPTGFHVNVLEVGGTAQTANDNGADINTLVTRVTAAVATEAKQDTAQTDLDTLTDSMSDLSNGAPTDTPTPVQALMYLYSALTNKVVTKTSGTPDYLEFYNGAGTLIWRKQVSDDAADYTELEGVSGS